MSIHLLHLRHLVNLNDEHICLCVWIIDINWLGNSDQSRTLWLLATDSLNHPSLAHSGVFWTPKQYTSLLLSAAFIGSKRQCLAKNPSVQRSRLLFLEPVATSHHYSSYLITDLFFLFLAQITPAGKADFAVSRWNPLILLLGRVNALGQPSLPAENPCLRPVQWVSRTLCWDVKNMPCTIRPISVATRHADS